MKAIPLITTMLSMTGLLHSISAQALSRYNHGEPSAEEQYLLELANRARANPAAEGKRLADTTDPDEKLALDFFKVDRARVKREFASYAPRPPLAMNPQLTKAARRHSADMAKNHFQGHTGSDGSTTASRLVESGYSPIAAANESVYSNYVPDLSFAHAGFQVDWGYGSGGVQPGLGHRDNIMNFHNTVFKEVGMGVTLRSGMNAQRYGKVAVAQKFGTRFTHPLFLVGVVYHDANNNHMCEPGEGLPGIEVTPSVGSHYAVTSQSGGYSIPFFAPHKNATVTFKGKGLDSERTLGFSVVDGNTKVDLRLSSYTAPTVRFKVLDAVASERGKRAEGDARIRVIRSGPKDDPLQVKMQRTIKAGKGKATPNDYRLSALAPAKMQGPASGKNAFTLTIPGGKQSADFKLVAIKDKQKEGNEKVSFTIRKGSDYRASGVTSAAISIKD